MTTAETLTPPVWTEKGSTSVEAAPCCPQPVRATAGPPAIGGVSLLDLRPGDVARLPVHVVPARAVFWSSPVTIARVLLIDSELVEVRWETERPEDAWEAHALLTGEAYRAGAVRLSRESNSLDD